MSNFGAKVSDEEVEVVTAGSRDLIYSTKWSNFKIVEVLTVQVVRASGIGTSSQTVANPISYAPFFSAFVQSSNEPGYYYEAKAWNGMLDNFGAIVRSIVTFDPITNEFTCKTQTFAGWPGGTLTFKIVVYADILTGNAAILDSGGDYGAKASLEGSSASDIIFCLTPRQKAKDSEMSFTTKFRNLTVFDDGLVDTTLAGGNTVTINHNLGYVPIVTAYQFVPGENYKQRLPSYYSDGEVFPEVLVAHLKVSSSSLIISDLGYVDDPDITYYYIVFNERLV